MRNLFLLLVLVNLGVLAWFAWFSNGPAPGPRYDGPGITLLREADPDAAILSLEPPEPPVSERVPVADPQPEVALAPPQPDRCVAIGPFTEPDAADSALARLAEQGFEPRLTTTEEEVWAGHWVYIDRVVSLDQARAIDAELDENGIEEAYVIGDSDSGILISLGVFSETARAASQVARAQALGYVATIADSTDLEETHWLEVSLSEGQSIELESLQEPGQISRLEERRCEGGAA